MVKLGLIGERLSHSLSPQLHKEMMKELHIDGTYELIEIEREHFEESFRGLQASGFHGLNVTIPYKETVIPYLDEISPMAKYIGAVNTILFQDGKIKGFNTDYYGFLAVLKQHQIIIKGQSAIILGSGGVAKTVAKVLLDNGIFDITIVSRGKNSFHGLYSISYDFFLETLPKADLMINCTPVGMFPHVDDCPIPKSSMFGVAAIDLIYNPEKTHFLKNAEDRGMKICNGSLMLREQAKKAYEFWF